MVHSYVETVPSLRWCASGHCSRVVHYSGGGARDIECECGTRYCFACGLAESHSPAQCEIVDKWNRKANSDDENRNWLIANTKPCPGCKTPIEKNSGCNHMTCKSCKFDFCWLCKGEWSRHGSSSGGYYNCNIYEAVKTAAGSTVSEEERSAENAKATIKRYQFYYERFLEYQKSIASAVGQVNLTLHRMEALQCATGVELSRVEFLLDANKTVIECRRALKWSYVIAFYLRDDSRQQLLFRQDQGRLEKFSDELHGLIEMPLERLLH